VFACGFNRLPHSDMSTRESSLPLTTNSIRSLVGCRSSCSHCCHNTLPFPFPRHWWRPFKWTHLGACIYPALQTSPAASAPAQPLPLPVFAPVCQCMPHPRHHGAVRQQEGDVIEYGHGEERKHGGRARGQPCGHCHPICSSTTLSYLCLFVPPSFPPPLPLPSRPLTLLITNRCLKHRCPLSGCSSLPTRRTNS